MKISTAYKLPTDGQRIIWQRHNPQYYPQVGIFWALGMRFRDDRGPEGDCTVSEVSWWSPFPTVE